MRTKKQASWMYGAYRREKALTRLKAQLFRTGRYEGKPELSIEQKARIEAEIKNIELKTK